MSLLSCKKASDGTCLPAAGQAAYLERMGRPATPNQGLSNRFSKSYGVGPLDART